jgi:hypothetical protein
MFAPVVANLLLHTQLVQLVTPQTYYPILLLHPQHNPGPMVAWKMSRAPAYFSIIAIHGLEEVLHRASVDITNSVLAHVLFQPRRPYNNHLASARSL